MAQPVPRRVYFGFDYEDVKSFRVNVVRNSDILKRDIDGIGFYDASIWEEAERHGDAAVKRLINEGLENSSVTCILIGTRTWQRRWVRYEILKSYDRGNKLLGIHINSIPDKNKQTFAQGPNPFAYVGFVISSDGRKLTYHEHDGAIWKNYQDLPTKATNFENKYWNTGHKLSNWVPLFDWIGGNGYANLPTWIDSAK